MALFAPFRPPNSLVLAYERLTPDGIEELEAQVDEVGKYYRFVTLSELVTRRRRRSLFHPADGLAAVVFTEARKSLFQFGMPSLRGRKIPVTVFLHPDCVGLTRLPLDEELGVYRRFHSEAFPGETIDTLADRAWLDPVWGEAQLARARKELGPLPLGELDPLQFFIVWRQLLDIPPDLLDCGLRLPASPLSTNRERIEAAKAFTESRLKVPVTLAAAPRRREISSTNEGDEVLQSLGFSACLHRDYGIIDDKTDLFRLPQWHFPQNQG